MQGLACEIIAAGGSYDDLNTNLRRKVADIVPPHVLAEDTKAILSFLGVGPKPTFHYVLIC